MIWLDEPFATLWKNKDIFEEVKKLQGEIYRYKEGRKTLRFELNGEGYFLKLHEGVGWKEIVKNLIQLRMPVLGAKNEYEAIKKMADIGIDSMTVVGYGVEGINPAKQKSFLITKELTNVISLEDVCAEWLVNPPDDDYKTILIERVATITKKMHEAGVNHRDYYLCHFLLENNKEVDIKEAKIYLIDLHRAQIRKCVPDRWLIKDLSALFYSVLDIGLTKKDIGIFVQYYGDIDIKMKCRIKKWAEKIYRRDFAKSPIWPK